MRWGQMQASKAKQLAALERRLGELKRELATVGFLIPGSVVRRFMPCGKPGCRCQGDPPKLHGPYWQWTTKPRSTDDRGLKPVFGIGTGALLI